MNNNILLRVNNSKSLNLNDDVERFANNWNTKILDFQVAQYMLRVDQLSNNKTKFTNDYWVLLFIYVIGCDKAASTLGQALDDVVVSLLVSVLG